MILEHPYSLEEDPVHIYDTFTRQASIITKPAGTASRTVERYIDEMRSIMLRPATAYDVEIYLPYQTTNTKAMVGIAVEVPNAARMWLEVKKMRIDPAIQPMFTSIRASKVFTGQPSSPFYPSAIDTTYTITAIGTVLTLPGVASSLSVLATIICEQADESLELVASIRGGAILKIMERRRP